MNKNRIFSAAFIAILVGVASLSVRASTVENLYGEAAAPTDSSRTINVTSSMKWVEVKHGETVKFVVAGKDFAWKFDVPDTQGKFSMNKIAPLGVLDRNVDIYMDGRPRD
jgi:hypothetical protein